jgi:hypothetical protein
MRELSIRRVLSALVLFAMIVAIGGVSIWGLGEGRSASSSRRISPSTRWRPSATRAAARGESRPIRTVNMFLIVAGIGAIASFNRRSPRCWSRASLPGAFRRRRMDRKILPRKHFVIAGCGRTGKFVVELATVGRDFVAIDRDLALLERLNEDRGRLIYVVGATDDHARCCRPASIAPRVWWRRCPTTATTVRHALHAQPEPQGTHRLQAVGSTARPDPASGRRLDRELEPHGRHAFGEASS